MTQLLITADELAAQLDEVRVLDATVDLVRPAEGGRYNPVADREGFEAGHIPGAGFADLVSEFADPAAPHPFGWPNTEQLAAAAGAAGIGDSARVVVYSHGGLMWATRLWFLLRAHGLETVSVLDGGFDAWRAAGLLVEVGAAGPVEPASFTGALRPGWLATRDEVLAISDSGGSCLLNALRPEVFRGDDGGTTYGRAGHIPGSVNVPHPGLLDADGRFLPPDQLREQFAAAGALDGRPLVAYCGGGISATLDLFALTLAGRADGRLYDGSLAEWAADPSLPLAVSSNG